MTGGNEAAGGLTEGQLKRILEEQKKLTKDEAARETLRVAASMVQTCDGSTHEDTRRWIEEIEMAEPTVTTDIMRLVRRTVAGSLRKEVEKLTVLHKRNDDPNQATWKNVKEGVVTAFLPADEITHMRGRMEKVKQAEKEDIQTFNRRFRDMAEIAYPLLPDKTRSDETELTLVRLYGRAIYSDTYARKLAVKGEKKIADAMKLVTNLSGDADKYDFLGRTRSRQVDAVEKSDSDVDQVSSFKKEVSRLANILADKKGKVRQEMEAYVLSATQGKSQGGRSRDKKGRSPKQGKSAGKESKFPKKKSGKSGQKSARKPKWDKDGRPRCFNCNEYGHYARDCKESKPAKKQSGNGAAGTDWS